MKVTKGFNGWSAEDVVKINDKMSLRVTTRKVSSGGIVCDAVGVEVTPMGFVWQPFSDFKAQLGVYRTMRCTEKSVKEVQAQCMAGIAVVLESAQAFYAKKG